MKKSLRNIDTTDLEILTLLFKDAGASNKDIAAKVNLAPSSCLERIKKLQSDRVIDGQRLNIDFKALGGHIQAMISVRLSNHSRNTVALFQQALIVLPEVISLYHMGGENDFLVHVTVSDSLHLRDFIFNAVTAREEVNHVETALVYDYKISDSLPNLLT